MSIVSVLNDIFKRKTFSLAQAYEECADVNPESVRARIYENIGVYFERVGRGVYFAKDRDEEVVLIEGDGRKLDFIEDASIDSIITDHPWYSLANIGRNRNFARYECFNYTIDDFKEKYRVLKEGAFLVEFIPEETEANFDYLYSVKKMAQEAGFMYFAKVPWVKENFISNTGRKAKNTEDVLIFSKGTPRKLRYDKQRSILKGEPCYMQGPSGMLPTCFSVPAVPYSERICQSEKPCSLIEKLLDYVTLENETVLDQFAGSGVVGEACVKKHRNCILIEKGRDQVESIIKRLHLTRSIYLAETT